MNNNKIIKEYKVIHDCVHGYIQLSNMVVSVMDSKEFQRLRKLKQLGTCYFVFQNAVHTRFEHSIGTSYLAGKLMDRIVEIIQPNEIDEYMSKITELSDYYKNNYGDNKYCIDKYIIELVKIAALCHDLGHGPFSHVFDDYLEKQGHNPLYMHENRSCLLLEKIIVENNFLASMISKNEIKFMQNLINPKEVNKGFIYQIVSNYLNGLDVDKYDYLDRDSQILSIGSFKSQRLIDQIRIINNNICYPEQSVNDILELYNTRYNLHKTVYGHKSVRATQYMITEIFEYLDKVIGITESVNDMNYFCKLTDEYILCCHNILLSKSCLLNDSELNKIQKAKHIIDMLDRHEMYKHVETYIDDHKFSITAEMIDPLNVDDIIITNSKIGFVSGSKDNPLDSIFVYKTKSLDNLEELKAFKIDIHKYSLLIPNNYQEYVTMIFCKSKDKDYISKLREKIAHLMKS